jgi:hypothetical protein
MECGDRKCKAPGFQIVGYSISFPQWVALAKFNFSCTTVADKNTKYRFVDLVNMYYTFLMDPSVTWKYYINLQDATRPIQLTKTNFEFTNGRSSQMMVRSGQGCYCSYCPVMYQGQEVFIPVRGVWTSSDARGAYNFTSYYWFLITSIMDQIVLIKFTKLFRNVVSRR